MSQTTSGVANTRATAAVPSAPTTAVSTRATVGAPDVPISEANMPATADVRYADIPVASMRVIAGARSVARSAKRRLHSVVRRHRRLEERSHENTKAQPSPWLGFICASERFVFTKARTRRRPSVCREKMAEWKRRGFASSSGSGPSRQLESVPSAIMSSSFR
jgi:hypothetical protein